MEDSGQNLKSKNTLKTFFQKGDIPEEDQFADLIDAFRHMDDGHTITNVFTAPNGIISITLSNGTVVAITPPVTDEYVPKTGGEFTGNIGIGGPVTDKALHTYGSQVRIETAHGYGSLGAENADAFHFETDLPEIWLGSDVRSYGDLGLSGKNTFMRYDDGAILENNQRVATQNWTNNQGFLKENTATNFVRKDRDENNAFFNDYLIFNHNSTSDVDAISFNPSTNGFYFNAATGKSNSSANASVYVNKVIAFDDIATAESVHVAGNVYAGAGSQGSAYFGDGKEIIRFNDGWLRLNPSTTSATRFDSGIYCGTSKLRTDGQFEVGSNGDKFKVTTSGAVSTAGMLTVGGNVSIALGHGKGLRFWGNDNYKIYMSSATDATWGGRMSGETTSDYNMYFRMTGGTNRGFVFKNDHNEVAGIDASGNARFNGTIYEGGTTLSNKYLSKTEKAADSEKVDGINGASLLRSDANDTFTGTLAVGSTSTRQAGIYGIYDSTKVGHIWSMGTNYKISQTGANFGNLYGFAYKHTNNPTGGTMAGNHQAVWCNNGTPKVALGDNIWTSGIIYEGGTALSSKYLSKTGGTMTGSLTVTGSTSISANEFRVGNSNTKLTKGANNSFKMSTNNGYIDVGAQNTSYAHFQSNLPKFYFNKSTEVNGDIKLYQKNTYVRHRDGAATENGERLTDKSFSKSGGTMTGNLTMTNHAIRWAENTDVASIGFKNDSDADSNSYMYFKTGDNNNEHFKWLHRASGSSTDSVWMTLKDSSLSVKGNIYSNGTAYFGDGKEIIRFSDGWLRINPDSDFGAGIYCGSSILRTDGQLEVGGNGSKFKVTSGGTVTSAGSITSAGNVTAYSDKRLKTALQPIKENILDKIDQLKPTFYQWKDKAKDQARQLGFIAQEVKEVFPEWVHENEEYYSMSYDKMGAVIAVQGIQELRAEIKSLKEELKTLKDGLTK